MAKGSLYRAVQRTGGFQPIVDLISNLMQRKKAAEDFGRVQDAYSQSTNRIQGLKTGSDPNDIAELQNNNPVDLLFGQTPTKAGSPEEKTNMQTPGDYILGDILPVEERYKRAGDTARNFVSDTVLNPDINENVMRILPILAGSLESQAAGLKPKERKITPVNKNTVAFMDNDGNLVNNPYFEKPAVKAEDILLSSENQGGMRIDKYGIKGKKIMPEDLITPMQQTKEEIASGSPQDFMLGDYIDIPDQVKKVSYHNLPDGSSKNSTDSNIPDVSDEISDLSKAQEEYKRLTEVQKKYEKEGPIERKDTKGNKYYSYDFVSEEGKPGELYPGDIEQLKKRKFSQIKGITDGLVQKLDISYPGFNKFINGVFKKVGNDPKNIDKVINEYKNNKDFKDVPFQFWNFAKQILNARIF